MGSNGDRGHVYLEEQGGVVRLGNDLVELGFSAETGALVSLLDKRSGCELLRHREAPRSLAGLTLLNVESREFVELDSADAGELDWQAETNGTRAALRLRAARFPQTAVWVEVTVALEADSPLTAWRMRVGGLGPGFSVHQCTCPALSGLMKAGEPAPGECLVVPMHGEGFVFRDPYPVVDGLPLMAGTGPEAPAVGVGRFYGQYPGLMSVQMVLYYNDFAGVYLATHDVGQNIKGFSMGPRGDDVRYPVIFVSHFAGESPGAEAAWDYDTVLGVFHGDWYDGADLYKAWARQQWWCEKRLSERDLPQWAREGFGVFQMSNYHIPVLKLNHSLGEIADTVNGVAAEAGVPIVSLIFNYENGGGWSGPKGLLPPREGECAFRGAMQELRDAGNHGFVYIPGGTWYVALRKYQPPFDSWPEFERDGRPNAEKNVQGEVRISGWYEGWEVARLCPATEFLKRLTIDMTVGCLELGCDVVQIDNFPCGGVAEPCYDLTHDHPPGHGAWRAQAWADLLAETRRHARAANPDCLLTTEGIAEGFIPWVDLYDMRAGNMEYFGHWVPGLPMGGQTIPLFGYLYSGYIGAYLAAMPEGNRPEVRYWTLCLGRALAQGVVPSTGKYFPEPRELNPTTLGFYVTVLRAARDCWKYLMFGEMVRPPPIEVPTVEASYFRFVLDGQRHEMDGRQRHVTTDAAVQHSAWRAEDGSLAWVFANVTQEPVAFDVTLDPAGDADSRWDVEVRANGVTCTSERGVSLPRSMSLQMEPLSVIVVTAAKPGEPRERPR